MTIVVVIAIMLLFIIIGWLFIKWLFNHDDENGDE